jgi:hypothetical protein
MPNVPKRVLDALGPRLLSRCTQKEAELTRNFCANEALCETERTPRIGESGELAKMPLTTQGGRCQGTDEAAAESHPVHRNVLVGAEAQSLRCDLREPVQNDASNFADWESLRLFVGHRHDQLLRCPSYSRTRLHDVHGLAIGVLRQ